MSNDTKADDERAVELISELVQGRADGPAPWLPVQPVVNLIRAVRSERDASLPDDLRAGGWTVAVHNDYRQDGKQMTFWLFTKGNRCVKGEGLTDAEALNQVRAAVGAGTEET